MSALAKRQRLKQERRHEIIQAAVRVFLARSVQAATMDEIAKEAGVSKGCLYVYFASKDELFVSVAIEWLGELQDQLDKLRAQAATSGLELLRRGAKLYVRHALESPGHFQVAMSWLNSAYVVDESTPLFSEYRAAIGQKYEFMTAAIDAAKRDGSFVSRIPSGRIGIQLWGAILGLILVEQNSDELARRLPVAPPTHLLCESFIETFLSALAASGRPAEHLEGAPLEAPSVSAPSKQLSNRCTRQGRSES